MISKTLLSQESSFLSLSEEILNRLTSYEDYLSLYIQIQETSNAFSWWKADLFNRLSQKFGTESLLQLAREMNEKSSTVTNYIRVAKAFSPEKRLPEISFSHHFQASWIDSFDGENFSGEERYRLIERAVDEHMSTRQIAAEVKQTKEDDPEKKEIERKLYRVIATLRNMFKDGKYEEINKLYEQLIA